MLSRDTRLIRSIARKNDGESVISFPFATRYVTWGSIFGTRGRIEGRVTHERDARTREIPYDQSESRVESRQIGPCRCVQITPVARPHFRRRATLRESYLEPFLHVKFGPRDAGGLRRCVSRANSRSRNFASVNGDPSRVGDGDDLGD